MKTRTPRCWTRSPAKTAAAVALLIGSLAAGIAGFDASRPHLQHAHAVSVAQRIDVNTASLSQLRLLPGIGSTIARRIVEYRQIHGPFLSLKALDDVRGIGPKTLKKIAPYASVHSNTHERDTLSL